MILTFSTDDCMTVSHSKNDLVIICVIIGIVFLCSCFSYTVLIIYCTRNQTMKNQSVESDRKEAIRIQMMEIHAAGEVEGVANHNYNYM